MLKIDCCRLWGLGSCVSGKTALFLKYNALFHYFGVQTNIAFQQKAQYFVCSYLSKLLH